MKIIDDRGVLFALADGVYVAAPMQLYPKSEPAFHRSLCQKQDSGPKRPKFTSMSIPQHVHNG